MSQAARSLLTADTWQSDLVPPVRISDELFFAII